jgi:hypothetical protein
MSLRSEYSLGHSEFNDFLFAFVGEEKSGLQLTVLSALARLGFDPWEEAARLSKLPQESATSALTETIAGLPEGDWKASDSRSIAVRLLDRLPRRRSTADSSRNNDGEGPEQKSKTQGWLVWVAFAAILAAIFWQQSG